MLTAHFLNRHHRFSIVISTLYLLAIGYSAGDTIHVPDDAPTIQAGIDLAKDGQTVLVAPGTYNEAVTIEGKSITLASSGGAEKTIIDGTGLDTSVVMIIFSEANGSAIRGFTITGGTGYGPEGYRMGGGLYLEGSADVIIEDCIVTGNQTDYVGGGIYAAHAWRARFRRVLIEDNHALYGGGSIIRDGGIDANPRYWPHFVECTFRKNSATLGGGLYVSMKSMVRMADCVFEHNVATGSTGGGGVFIYYSVSAGYFQRCHFVGNSTNGYGGAILGYALIDRCTFVSNDAALSGGAAYLRRDSRVWFSRFVGNKAGERGGAVDATYSHWPEFLSCDFSGNAAVIEGGAIFTQVSNNMSLENTVLCENAPDHIVGPFVDNGGNHLLDYCPVPQTLYVPGEYATIQLAIEAAMHGDVIAVGPGVYQESINFLGKRIALISSKGAEETVIDAGGAGSVIQAKSGEGAGTLVRGFTLTGGAATLGGGIHMSRSLLAVEDCNITDNDAGSGGGAYAQHLIHSWDVDSPRVRCGGVLTIARSVVRGNRAPTSLGGGLRGIIVAEDTDIVDNVGGYGGGAVAWEGSRFINCTFRHNTANNSPVGGLACVILFSGEGVAVGDTVFCANAPQHTGGNFDDLGGNVFLDTCAADQNPADLNGDGVVDVLDLLILLDAWGACNDCDECAADLNNDCAVDVLDLLILLDNWGQ